MHFVLPNHYGNTGLDAGLDAGTGLTGRQTLIGQGISTGGDLLNTVLAWKLAQAGGSTVPQTTPSYYTPPPTPPPPKSNAPVIIGSILLATVVVGGIIVLNKKG